METFANIIGYIILGISILITLGYCFKIRETAKNDQSREKSMELQAFLMTASVIITPLMNLSNFHLLWLIPASFILGLLSIGTPLNILWFFSSIYFSFWYIGISNVGRKYYVDGEYDKAINAYKEEISKNPSAVVYFNLGLAYGKTGQHDKEIAAYEEAVKLKPKQPELHFNLGTVHNNLGNRQQAISALKEAIRLSPEYLKAHYIICIAYSEIGDRENAIKEYEIVKKLDNELSKELASVAKLENTEKETENLEDKIEENKRKLEILLKQKSDVWTQIHERIAKEMLQLQSSANTINQPIESAFTLCSKHSISLALKNINMLTQNNENDKRYYKSFRSLKCSREDLKRSFYFLKDCVYFCENEPLYNNSEFLSSLSGLAMQVVISYLDVDPNDIPNDIRENHNFGSKFEQTKNLGEKQLEELKLINWRSKEHWQFWAEKYGKTDILAQYCLDQANK